MKIKRLQTRKGTKVVMEKKFKAYVISHTHWDREWYQTFQFYRKRLVDMLDEVIDFMETNEDYTYFHFDGQTILIEDYLQIRPKNEKRLARLIQSGRIIIGPWYVMPDEFLISGESIVRNLQKGFQIAKKYGTEPMKNGYVVDIFGHNAQFPQILSGFDIHAAVLFRGIGEYLKDTFHWIGADGSKVLCLKLDRERSYSNFYFAIRRPFEGREYEEQEVLQRAEELLKYSKELATSRHLLLFDGVDHLEIDRKLPTLLTLFNNHFEDTSFEQTTLQEYIDAKLEHTEDYEEIVGELYEVGKRGINNQVLKNVLSSMVHLKQANNLCEMELTRWAEPFDVIAEAYQAYASKEFLDLAWEYLMKNHPHDSICGCSIGRVHKDNEYRYHQVMDLSQTILDTRLNTIVKNINSGGFGFENMVTVFNPSPYERYDVIYMDLEFEHGDIKNFKIFDDMLREYPYQILAIEQKVTKKIINYRELISWATIDVYRVAVQTSVPALGHRTFFYKTLTTIFPTQRDFTYREFYEPVRYLGSMKKNHNTWENQFLEVTISEKEGLKVIYKKTGKRYQDFLTFEDSGDVGDGWNYKKPKLDTVFHSSMHPIQCSILHDGPLLVQWEMKHYLQLPEGINEDLLSRSSSRKELVLSTFITMKKGSAVLSFETKLQHQHKDHRMRVLFPTYLKTSKFKTSTPFCLEERNIPRQDRSQYVEMETNVYPNQGFILLRDDTDAVAVINKGLYEVEVSDDESKQVALTLFRAFRHETLQKESTEGQLHRDLCFEYAIVFSDSTSTDGQLLNEGNAYRLGLKSICAKTGIGTIPLTEAYLTIDNKDVILSAYKSNEEGMNILRLYNSSDQTIEVPIHFNRTISEAYLMDLKEEIKERLNVSDKSILVTMSKAQILTIGTKLERGADTSE